MCWGSCGGVDGRGGCEDWEHAVTGLGYLPTAGTLMTGELGRTEKRQGG